MFVIGRELYFSICLDRPIILKLIVLYEKIIDELEKQRRASLTRVIIGKSVVLNPSSVRKHLVELLFIKQILQQRFVSGGVVEISVIATIRVDISLHLSHLARSIYELTFDGIGSVYTPNNTCSSIVLLQTDVTIKIVVVDQNS